MTELLNGSGRHSISFRCRRVCRCSACPSPARFRSRSGWEFSTQLAHGPESAAAVAAAARIARAGDSAWSSTCSVAAERPPARFRASGTGSPGGPASGLTQAQRVTSATSSPTPAYYWELVGGPGAARARWAIDRASRPAVQMTRTGARTSPVSTSSHGSRVTAVAKAVAWRRTAPSRCWTWPALTANSRWPCAVAIPSLQAHGDRPPRERRGSVGRSWTAGRDVRSRAPRGGRHVRGRSGRPPRRRAAVQHHPPPESAADPDDVPATWRRSCEPQAPLCVLDLYDRPPGRRPDSGSYLGLFFHLTSGADTYSQEEVSRVATWDGGFEPGQAQDAPAASRPGPAPGQAHPVRARRDPGQAVCSVYITVDQWRGNARFSQAEFLPPASARRSHSAGLLALAALEPERRRRCRQRSSPRSPTQPGQRHARVQLPAVQRARPACSRSRTTCSRSRTRHRPRDFGSTSR